MKRYIKAYLAAGLMAALFASPLYGQSDGTAGTPAALQLLKYRSLWMQSRNAAGSYLDRPSEFATVSAGYHLMDGNFHMPQQGGKLSGLTLNAEGTALLNSFYAWGEFNYRRDKVDDVLYNCSIIDPYRGMPYYSIDDIASQWRYEDYSMRFRVASHRFWNFLHIGLEGTYQAQSGAKQYDYRTENKSMFLELRPGVAIAPESWRGHSIGLNFEYFSYKEEAAMDRDNVSSPIKYYDNFGLGMGIDRGSASGRAINYTGNSLGGAVQYNFSSRCGGVLVEGSYRCKVEDQRISWSNPRKPASVKDRIWEAKALYYQRTSSLTHNITLSASDRSIDGIEYLIRDQTAEEEARQVMAYVRSTYHIRNAELSYRLICPRGDEYSWLAEVGARYISTDNKYLLPVSTINYKNMEFNAGFRKNFNLSDRLTNRLLLEGSVAYKHNLEGDYTFGGTFPDYPTVKLETANMAYLTSDYFAFDIAATYSQKFRPASRANLFVKARFGMLNTNDNGFDDRYAAGVSIGCNF